jgi:hypothetical protein
MITQFLLAARVFWIITGFITTFILITVFTVPSNIILNVTPECQQKKETGVECATCGLSRGFTHISSGDIESANKLNRSSIIVFAAFSLNSVFFFIYGIRKLYINHNIKK